ncbi:hypothetical protein Vafri_3813 [Volvox africanus]|uniref:Uncharacterized protein n=1 Tax=Volvox africanus TaxID=51714 RepID=A0A8J4AU86_9CHLO|nr:hypothetical protein Vafri_3813 [Volvox africanus]
MARILLETEMVNSSANAKMGGLAGGAWLGIGLSCGFVIGIITYAFIACLIRRRKNIAPHPEVRASSQRANGGGFTNLAQQPSNNNLSTAILPSRQPLAGDMFYSPLQSCMVKGSNVRGSANPTTLPDPGLYGGHGFALMQTHPAASSTLSTSLPQADADVAPLPDSSAPAPLTPTDKATPHAVPLQSQLSTCDTVDQGRQQARQQHQRMFSVADAYGADELDDEWAVVLGDLDGLLAKKGQPGLASPERAVAVRRLIAVTGSRGMQFALDAAFEDVMRYRARK